VSELDWTILAAVVMAVGLVGTILPILPGLLLIWVSALVYGFATGWNALGIIVMVVMTVGVVVGIVKGFVVPKKAADEYGASGWAQLGALVGGVAGFFMIPVVGLPVGALLGIFLVELLRLKEWEPAWRATKGTAIGFGKSALIDFGLGTVMVLTWAAWAITVV
jgi:uncharacterized protein YqgC (DUF456 family)